MSDVDAAILWEGGKKIFFFRGAEYIRFDVEADTVDPGYPKPIAGNWPGLPFTDGIDAAVLWPGGKAFLFKGDQYVRFDIAADTVAAGYPKPIAGNWPGLPFTDGVDAAILWQSEQKIFFFRGSEYVRFDVQADTVDPGYPKPIAGNWPGLPFTDGIDAAVLWPGGKAFLFKGDQYVRFDIAADAVEPGYPKPIVGNWPGLNF